MENDGVAPISRSAIIHRMQVLRNAHLLARFVLVWFALSIGAAIASPLIQPKDILLICTGSGAMKVLVQADENTFHKRVVEVMEMARRSGLRNLAIATKPEN